MFTWKDGILDHSCFYILDIKYILNKNSFQIIYESIRVYVYSLGFSNVKYSVYYNLSANQRS